MFDRGDDKLATFVVASAAYSTLRELVKAKGDSFQIAMLRAALFGEAKRRLLGLPAMLSDEPSVETIVDEIAERIRSGEIKNEDDLKLVLSKDDEREMIRHQTDPYNFLKHADRDPGGSLDEDEIDPFNVIVSALAAYSALFPFETMPMEVPLFLKKHGVIDPAFGTP